MHQPPLVAFITRISPIIAFLITISIVVNLCSRAGVFEAVAGYLARFTSGRPWRLWFAVSALTTVSTVFLSLDTAAVFITPLAIAMATAAGVNGKPVLISVAILANTTSLLLPVSNLTNLLATHRGVAVTPADYLRLSTVPAVVAILASMLVLAVCFRRQIRGSAARPPTLTSPRPLGVQRFNRRHLGTASVVLVVLLPALATPIPYWISTSVAAAVLLVVFAVRDQRVLRVDLVPWRVITLAVALIALAHIAYVVGLRQILQDYALTAGSPGEILSLSSLGAVLSNAVNNLPAYLMLEPLAESGLPALVALLIGVNAGPIVTPWGSVATLLWHDQLRRNEITLSWWEFVRIGSTVAPIVVALASLAYAGILPAG